MKVNFNWEFLKNVLGNGSVPNFLSVPKLSFYEFQPEIISFTTRYGSFKLMRQVTPRLADEHQPSVLMVQLNRARGAGVPGAEKSHIGK